MTMTVAFDTLKYSKRLQEAGVPREQAEIQAEAFAEIVDEKLATKHDLKELEYRLIIKLGGMLVFSIGVVATLVKIL